MKNAPFLLYNGFCSGPSAADISEATKLPGKL